jgi:hypothetical protein
MKIGIDFMPMGPFFLMHKCSKNGKTDKCNSLCHRILSTVKHSLPVKTFSAREKMARRMASISDPSCYFTEFAFFLRMEIVAGFMDIFVAFG